MRTSEFVYATLVSSSLTSDETLNMPLNMVIKWDETDAAAVIFSFSPETDIEANWNFERKMVLDAANGTDQGESDIRFHYFEADNLDETHLYLVMTNPNGEAIIRFRTIGIQTIRNFLNDTAEVVGIGGEETRGIHAAIDTESATWTF